MKMKTPFLVATFVVSVTMLTASPVANASSVRAVTQPVQSVAKDVRTFSDTECNHNWRGQAMVCIFVNSSGLRVNYATVTNRRAPAGKAIISSTWDGKTHPGPRIDRDEAWRFDYNRIMNDGNKVCGSVEGLWVACVTIKR